MQGNPEVGDRHVCRRMHPHSLPATRCTCAKQVAAVGFWYRGSLAGLDDPGALLSFSAAPAPVGRLGSAVALRGLQTDLHCSLGAP